MTYSMLITTMLCLWGTTSHADMGFDSKYERDYNIFNPATQYQPDNPLNPVNAYDPNSAFNPANRYDPGNPTNSANQYSPNNPFNPVNRYHPDNPLNPANRYNPNVPFAPLMEEVRGKEGVGTAVPGKRGTNDENRAANREWSKVR